MPMEGSGPRAIISLGVPTDAVAFGAAAVVVECLPVRLGSTCDERRPPSTEDCDGCSLLPFFSPFVYNTSKRKPTGTMCDKRLEFMGKRKPTSPPEGPSTSRGSFIDAESYVWSLSSDFFMTTRGSGRISQC